MLYLTLEQYEIVPFLSFALLKLGNTSFFTEYLHLPNSLLFAIFFLISINKVLNSGGSYDEIPYHVKKEFKYLYKEYLKIIRKMKLNGRVSLSDLLRLKQILVEILQLQDQYKFIPASLEIELREVLKLLLNYISPKKKIECL